MQSLSPSKRTRILFLCHDGKIYGSQKSLKLMVEHLPRDKYEVFVSFAREGPLMEVFQRMPHVTVLTHERLQGAKHSKRTLWKWLGDVLALLLSMGRTLRLARMIQEHRIDIVHTNSLASFEGGVAAKLANVPHVWHIRELFEGLRLTLGERMTKAWVHHLSARVLCISEPVYRQFEPETHRNPQKYRLVYNAIALPEQPAEHPSRATDDEELNLLFLGRISKGKRFHDILDAFCILKQHWQEKIPFRLKAYGEFICPEFERHVVQTIEQQGLSGCFELPGYRENVEECFSGMDLLLMPFSNTEAFGRVMLEALAHGVPVVACRSKAPLLEEGECAFFYQPNDARDLADCLNRVYQARKSLPQMRSDCIDKIRSQFHIHQQIQRIDSLYQELLSPSLRQKPAESLLCSQRP